MFSELRKFFKKQGIIEDTDVTIPATIPFNPVNPNDRFSLFIDYKIKENRAGGIDGAISITIDQNGDPGVEFIQTSWTVSRVDLVNRGIAQIN